MRHNGTARGASGASPAAAHMLAEMLDAGGHPVVPSILGFLARDGCAIIEP